MSFLAVAMPLIVAIAASVFYVDRLHTHSERLVIQGVSVTRDTKRLTSLLIDMERSARQYRVLGDAKLVTRFRQQANAYRSQMAALDQLHLNTLSDTRLDTLGARIGALSRQIGSSDAATDQVITTLDKIRDQNAQIGERGAMFVHRELNQLAEIAQTARRFLMICLFALVPLVIALGMLLTYVITRPLRQIADAINHLGAGALSREISVAAPVDELEQLSARLEHMRRRLVANEDEKQQFLRHVSHELKTPLASIREGTDLLTDGSMGALTASQQEVADIIARNGIELASLIENLLNFAAWREHHAGLEVTGFDLAGLIQRLVARHQLAVQTRELRVRTPHGPFLVQADLDRMQLIVDNLLANAIKHASHGGWVEIAIEHNARRVDLYVADSGAGVLPADRERIFEPFVQGENTPATASGVSGTGIGLSVVRDCALAHDGNVGIVSRAGCDSTFHVYIPQSDARV